MGIYPGGRAEAGCCMKRGFVFVSPWLYQTLGQMPGEKVLVRGGGVSILRLVGRAVQPWVLFDLSPFSGVE